MLRGHSRGRGLVGSLGSHVHQCAEVTVPCQDAQRLHRKTSAQFQGLRSREAPAGPTIPTSFPGLAWQVWRLADHPGPCLWDREEKQGKPVELTWEASVFPSLLLWCFFPAKILLGTKYSPSGQWASGSLLSPSRMALLVRVLLHMGEGPPPLPAAQLQLHCLEAQLSLSFLICTVDPRRWVLALTENARPLSSSGEWRG